MAAYPQRTANHNSEVPYYARSRKVSGDHSKSNLNQSFGSYGSGVTRDMNYRETFFQEGDRNRSHSIEGTPFISGKKNSTYVNPTFRTSSDFFHYGQTNSISQTRNPSQPTNKTEYYSRDHSHNNSIDCKDRRSSTSYKSEGRGLKSSASIAELKSITQQDKPKHLEPPLHVLPSPEPNININTSDITFKNDRRMSLNDSGANKITSNGHRNFSNAFTTTQKESYSKPYNKYPANEDPNDFMVPLDVANKNLIAQKSKQKEKEKALDQELDKNASISNARMERIGYEEHDRRRDALKKMLEDNISMLKEKERHYKNKLTEDLSSMVDVNQKVKLKSYLQENSADKNMVDRMTENHYRWNQRFEGQRDIASKYNEVKEKEEVSAKKTQKRVDLREDSIQKIGHPEIYNRRAETPKASSEYYSTPEKTGKWQSYSSTKSANKEPLSAESTVYQRVLEKSYNQFNPEVQKKNEHKLRELRLKEAYKALSEATHNKRIPYSTVSKFLYDQSKADIKY